MTDRVTIKLDGREIEVDAGTLIIQAAEDHGTHIPRFCWHPRMKPVGMCRMCLVEIETPRGKMLTTSCTTSCTEGLGVSTDAPIVKKAQEGVLEFLLINHPLDCPVCDRGGECPLQDQTLAYGPGESRFVEEKRHFEKPIPISDLVLLDRERCILCARCTRFSEEISGDALIEFRDRGYGTQIRTFPDEPFASYFSGNTVQLCPVGALTATPYRFRARPWDLETVPSVCTHCTMHDSVAVDVSQNQVLRLLGLDNDHTNHGWLSDKCRFGFEFISSSERLSVPLVRGDDGELRETGWSEALDVVAGRLGKIRDEHGGAAIAGLGGARGTNEDAYAFSKFLRVAAGTNNIDAQLGDGLPAEFVVGVTGRARIADLETAGTILVWGPDLKEEHPTLYLRVRRAAQELGATLIVVHPRATGLDDRADHKFTYRPGTGGETLTALAEGEGEFEDARGALEDTSLVVLVGRTGTTDQPHLAEAVAGFARSVSPDARVLPLVRRSNTYGALDMGLSSSLLPGRATVDGYRSRMETVWGPLPGGAGRDAEAIVDGLIEGTVRALMLLGADPVADCPDRARAEEAIEAAEFVVAVDLFLTESSRRADVVLPALGYGEKEGTVTNSEGRVQKVARVVAGPVQARPDWEILDDLAERMGAQIGLGSPLAISKEIAANAPSYEGVTWDTLEWEESHGVVVPREAAHQPLQYIPAAIQVSSVSAPMVLHHARTLYDDGVLLRKGLSLHKLAPGPFAGLNPEDAKRLAVGEGDTVIVSGGRVEAGLAVVIDHGLLPGVVYVPFNQPGGPALGTSPAVDVRKA